MHEKRESAAEANPSTLLSIRIVATEDEDIDDLGAREDRLKLID